MYSPCGILVCYLDPALRQTTAKTLKRKIASHRHHTNSNSGQKEIDRGKTRRRREREKGRERKGGRERERVRGYLLNVVGVVSD
jgi:hypothetical protein